MSDFAPNLIQDALFSAYQTAENEKLALLKQHFPNCFDKQGAFLPEKLAEMLQTEGVRVQRESYSLNWLGKSYARVLEKSAPETLLSEDRTHNQKPENVHSENLLIQGDNLEVLKHLRHAYKNQVKMIYIDPPYNTGSDGFVYQDDRKFTPDELAKLGGMDLDDAKRVLDFTAKKSNTHSAWLTFMYPRLYIARELLREDGVIFISIDDNEQAQLKILCDEVFGEENFVADIIWQKAFSPKNDAKFLSENHDYILVYAKDISQFKIGRLPRTEEANARYKNYDNDARGNWISDNLTVKTYSEKYDYPITVPSGRIVNPTHGSCWRVSKEKFEELKADNRIWFGQDGNNVPRLKRFLSEVQDEMVSTTLWFYQDVGHNQEGRQELKDVFDGKGYFDSPKPSRLLKRIFTIGNVKSNDLILDFFAGSGTTAHAVMQLNVEDKGNRRFICVQLPEQTEKKSEAYKAGYKSIFDITQARIEKAAAKIQAENPDYRGDLGFKIFQTEPNFQTALKPDIEPEQADWVAENLLLSGEQLQTLLTTWRLYDGAKLTEAVQAVDLGGYIAHFCRGHLYLLSSGFASHHIKALIEKIDNEGDFVPERIVLFGENMDSAMQKELAQAVKTYANKKALNNLSVLVRY